MNYGDRLRHARKASKLTQEQLANLSSVPQGTISKIERGDQESSAYDTILAHALDISAIWLTSGKGEMKQTTYKDNCQTKIMEEEGTVYEYLGEKEKQLLAMFKKLNEAQKDHILSSCSMFINPENIQTENKKSA